MTTTKVCARHRPRLEGTEWRCVRCGELLAEQLELLTDESVTDEA